MCPQFLSERRHPLGRPLTAPASEGAGGGGHGAIFPGPKGGGRGRQLEETWSSLLSQLRDPVDSTMRGSLSAGDIAYRLGELVHNYYRTRGVTLTSFELRRIVVALLDNYRSGWPTIAASTADLEAAFAGTPPPSRAATGTLVAFLGDDESRPRPPQVSWSGEPSPAAAPVITPDLPSALVSVKPRPSAPVGAAATEPRVASAPPPRAVEGASSGVVPPSPKAAPALGIDAALAAIMPVLQQQRGSAPALPAPRQEVVKWLRDAITAAMAGQAITVAEADHPRLEALAFDELFGLGPLEMLMRDEGVAAIFVNGPQAIFVERRGRLEAARVSFRDARQVEAVAERLAERAGVSVASEREPLIDRRLGDGTRVIIVTSPLAPGGPCLVVRRPSTRTVSLESLVAEGALSPQMASVLRLAVRSRLNVLVCGGPGVGKTALLAALARAAATDDRVVSVELTPELRPDVAHHVALLADGAPARALAAARVLRPDRLLVDDLTETLLPDIAEAAATGTDGIVASLMAASPETALERLDSALAAADTGLSAAARRRQLGHAFQLVVHLGRHRDGLRRITRLADLASGHEAIVCRDLFSFDPLTGRFVATGLRPSFLPLVARAGLEGAFLDAL